MSWTARPSERHGAKRLRQGRRLLGYLLGRGFATLRRRARWFTRLGGRLVTGGLAVFVCYVTVRSHIISPFLPLPLHHRRVCRVWNMGRDARVFR